MHFQNLQLQLRKREIESNCLILNGCETILMQQYLDMVTEIFGLPVLKLDNLKQVYTRLSKSLIRQNNTYVVYNDEDPVKENVNLNNLKKQLKENNLILVYTSKLDSRKTFTKENEKIIYDFEELSDEIVESYIQNKFKLCKINTKTLIRGVGKNLCHLTLEMLKVVGISESYNLSMDQAFEKALKSNLISMQEHLTIFNVVEMFCRRDTNILNYLNSEEVKKNIIPLLSVMYKNIRGMYLVQSCNVNDKISEKTGLTGFEIQLAKKAGKNYSIQELENMLKQIQKLDLAVKKGHIEPTLAFSFFVIKNL